MLNIDASYQYIIWSHDELLYEPFIHEGSLITYMLDPKITVGINEFFNITFSQQIGVRQMMWKTKELSIHHRTENTLTDYVKPNGDLQARGSILGDSKFSIKYLHKDAGIKDGFRIYYGLGFIIPSKSILLADPFVFPDDENDISAWNSGEYNHRHFSLSSGVYKASIETQIFYKQSLNPMFFGSVVNVDIPLSENKYDFSSGLNYSIASTMVWKRNNYNENKFNVLPLGFVFGFSYVAFEESSWNNIPIPNSKSTLIIPSIGGVFPTNQGAISISIRKPIFIEGKSIMAGNNVSPDVLNNKTDVYEISFGYRRNLGYMIPWL